MNGHEGRKKKKDGIKVYERSRREACEPGRMGSKSEGKTGVRTSHEEGRIKRVE